MNAPTGTNATLDLVVCGTVSCDDATDAGACQRMEMVGAHDELVLGKVRQPPVPERWTRGGLGGGLGGRLGGGLGGGLVVNWVVVDWVDRLKVM